MEKTSILLKLMLLLVFAVQACHTIDDDDDVKIRLPRMVWEISNELAEIAFNTPPPTHELTMQLIARYCNVTLEKEEMVPTSRREEIALLTKLKLNKFNERYTVVTCVSSGTDPY